MKSIEQDLFTLVRADDQKYPSCAYLFDFCVTSRSLSGVSGLRLTRGSNKFTQWKTIIKVD